MTAVRRTYVKYGLIIAAVVIIAIAIKLRGGHEAEGPARRPARPISVRTISAVPRAIPDLVWASGTVAPYAEAQLAPRIMSTVAAVYVREGDRVRRGQVLVRLESKDLAAQVASAGAAVKSADAMKEKAGTAVELQSAQTKANIANAEAALQIAEQQLSIAKEGPRRQEKAQAQLALVQAQAQFNNAETELARMKRLYEQDVIPKQRLDNVQTQYEVAKAQLGIAKQQVELADEGTRKQDLQAAQERVRQARETLRLAKAAAVQNKMAKREAQASASMVSQARAGERSARVMLGYATLTSPISGVVTARYVDPGDTASPGVPVLVVQDDSVYRLEAGVAGRDMSSIFPGLHVDIRLGADSRSGEGQVAMVVPAGDPATRKFTVKVNIPKSLHPISGDYGSVAFPVGYTRGIMIPDSAVHDQEGITNVFVALPNNRTDMRIVRTGRRTGNQVEIITGLRPGDRVITWSSAPLSDDAPVKVEVGR
jgi:RND family efflux transporter MFP subunit